MGFVEGSCGASQCALHRAGQTVAEYFFTVGGAARRTYFRVYFWRSKGTAGAGTGSGEVIKSDGYILTNNHVIAQAADGGTVEVRYADGTEIYLAFSGATEHPCAGEVIFADTAGHAHARRWTNRQSARSAASARTTTALLSPHHPRFRPGGLGR